MLEGIVLIKLVSIGAVALIASVAALAAALGDSNVAARAVDGIARQPKQAHLSRAHRNRSRGGSPIIALVIALILLYINPLV